MPLNEPGGFVQLRVALSGKHRAYRGARGRALRALRIRRHGERHPALHGAARDGRPQANLTVDGGNYNTAPPRRRRRRANRHRRVFRYSGRTSTPTIASRTTRTRHRPSPACSSADCPPVHRSRFLGRGEFGTTGTPGTTASAGRTWTRSSNTRTGACSADGISRLAARVMQQASYSLAMTSQRSTNLVADPPYTPSFDDRVAAFQSSDFLYDSGTNLQRHHFDYRADPRSAPNQTLTAAFAYDGERGVLTNHQVHGGATTARPQQHRHDRAVRSHRRPRVARRWRSLRAQRQLRFLRAPRVRRSRG